MRVMPSLKVWCYSDAHNWGTMLSQEAAKRGHDAHLFEDPRQPDAGYVFVHMHHHPQVRMLHKRLMAIMAMNPNLTLIPEYRSSVLYDDKLEQARQLPKWMPRTRVFYTPNAARRHLDAAPALPIMSKSAEGASSHNVRLLTTYEEARQEIKHAFSDIGIKCRYGQTQRGYLLWQDFVPGNEGDIRIIAIGTQRLILRRGNRADRPMASGSGNLTPITSLDDSDVCAALDKANEFFAFEHFNWCGIDLVKDEQGVWYVLETTVGWTLHGYYDCAFIDCRDVMAPRVREERGDKVWQVLLEEIERGVFE
jgi:glutathione synthase/RimK-type ligase-like ATP-grasp enzyme